MGHNGVGCAKGENLEDLSSHTQWTSQCFEETPSYSFAPKFQASGNVQSLTPDSKTERSLKNPPKSIYGLSPSQLASTKEEQT